jgi:chaperonin GroES
MMFEKIKPLGDRIVVKLIEHEHKTAGGLFTPSETHVKSTTGKVIAIGQGRRDMNGNLIPMSVCVGDEVYFTKYAGIEYYNDYLIMREDEVMGILI